MSLQERFEELRHRRRDAELGGGEERVRRQHQAGKRTARERLEILLQESLAAAVKAKAVEVKDLSKVVVDTTVKPSV